MYIIYTVSEKKMSQCCFWNNSACRLSYCFTMVFTADDKQLITSLGQLKG